MANGDGITYTTKELLERVDKKIDLLDEKLDRKADAATVAALDQRLTIMERQVEAQVAVNKALQSQSATNFTRREKVIATLVGLAALLVNIAVAVRGVIH